MYLVYVFKIKYHMKIIWSLKRISKQHELYLFISFFIFNLRFIRAFCTPNYMKKKPMFGIKEVMRF